MTDTAAHVALYARRNEVARFTIAVTGIDLTGVDMKMQVRLQRGNPVLLFALATVASAAAEGLKLESVSVTNGVPTSIIKGRINASTMTDATKVPYAGEIGSDQALAYAMTWTLGGDTQVRLEGPFVVVDSAYNSDSAPANRPASYGSPARAGGASGGALQFGDQVVQVSINDLSLVAAVAAGATAARDAALAAADRAEAAAAGGSYLAAAIRAAMNSRPRKTSYFDRSAPRPIGVPRISDGAVVDVGDNGYTTAVFTIQAGKPFRSYPASEELGDAYGLVWLDKDGSFIGAVPAPFAAGQVFTPPPTAVTALYPTYVSVIGRLLILPSEIAPGPLASHTPAFLSDIGGLWTGKAIGQIGDSISANASPVRVIVDATRRLNATFALDGCKPGRIMADALKKPDGTPFAQADVASLDAMNIWLGTNDYTGIDGAPATPVGVIGDAAGTATFIGYAKRAIEQLLTWKPTLLLSLTTLMYRADFTGPNATGARLTDYSAAIRSVAALYAIPVLDLERISGINAFNSGTMLGDTIHPNANGTALLSAKFVGFYVRDAPITPVAS